MTTRASIGHYRILRMLGQGGMGVVYAAHDERLDRTVAIKMLRGSAGDDQARARLWREARTAASVSHPNICPLYEIGEDDGELYIAMELLEGEPLSARTDRGPLPLGEAGATVLAILGALEALHRRGIVHRDLKPTNVFLTPHGVKLLDFGLARPTTTAFGSGDLTLTQPGMAIGTPRYMAPEQWRGETVDQRTDLFATGAMLFEMLSGKPAFGGEAVIEIYRAVMQEQPPALAGSQAVIAMDRVIHRALSKQPDDRYADAAAMAQDVRAALAVLDTAETPAVRAMKRLMVLPFRLLRPDPEIEFLAFSLPDAVSTSLSGLESLVVRSSHAASRFASDTLDPKAIASEAEVDAVVCGTLLRAGEQVRVAAQLVETPGGAVQWSKTTQVPLRDLFQLQDELAHQIVESLAIPLSTREHRRLSSDVPTSATAYEFYLRANEIANDMTKLTIARDLYRSALESDPGYAPAWARLGRAYRVLSKYGLDHVEDGERLAEEAYRKALELSPDLPLAHNLYTAFEVENLGRPEAAMLRLLSRAQQRTADPDLFSGLVQALRYCGLLDASLAAHRHAQRLDPGVRTSVMYTHLMRCEWEKAAAADIEYHKFVTYYVLPMMGRVEESVVAYRELESKLEDTTDRVAVSAMRAAVEGRRDDCVALSKDLFRPHFRDAEGLYFGVRNFAYVGALDEALDHLERVIGMAFYPVSTFRQDPWLDSLRSLPRFTALVDEAERRHRVAARAFSDAGGERLLGLTAQ